LFLVQGQRLLALVQAAWRILGFADVEDMESIEDPDCRARCERRALTLARQLMSGPSSITSISAVRQLAETLGEKVPLRRPAKSAG
jgi:5-methylthioribose kinase